MLCEYNGRAVVYTRRGRELVDSKNKNVVEQYYTNISSCAAPDNLVLSIVKFKPTHLHSELGRYTFIEVEYSPDYYGMEAYSNTAAAAAVACYNISGDRDKKVWLRSLLVLPEHRRNGLATGIMRLLVDKYGRMPVGLLPRPTADEPVSSEQLMGFYARFGFKPQDGRMMRPPGAVELISKSTASCV